MKGEKYEEIIKNVRKRKKMFEKKLLGIAKCISIVSGVAGLSILGIKCYDHFKVGSVKHEELGNKILYALTSPKITEYEKVVDEDLFTNVAIKMEEAIFDKGLETYTFDKTYDIGDNLSKLLSIRIESINAEK